MNLESNLNNIVEAATKEFEESKILQLIQSGMFSREQWKIFAIQRYIASLSFETSLRIAVGKAKESTDKELFLVFEMNLHDELGIDENGIQHKERMHETWRKDFYKAMEITEEELARAIPSLKTMHYQEMFQEFVQKDILTLTGAFLFLEYSLPREFEYLQAGRDKSWRENFVEDSTDPVHVKVEKARARIFLDDHISHDRTQHYPALLHALHKYLSCASCFERIVDGIQKIKEAKKVFYNSY